MAPMYPEMPGYETKETRLLKVYLPASADVLIAALGGGNSTTNYTLGVREVRLSTGDTPSVDLWEIQSVPKKG